MTKPMVVWLITTNRSDVLTYHNIMKKLEIRSKMKIDLKIVSWVRLYDSLVKAFREGNQPDLFALGTTWVATFAHLGYLEPIPQNIGFPPAIAPWIEECTQYKGVQYAVPYNMSPLVMCAQQNILDQNHITREDLKDFAGLYNACQRIDRNFKTHGDYDHMPFLFLLKADVNMMHSFFAFLFKKGWKFPDINNTDSTIVTEGLYETFQYMNSLLCISGNIKKEMYLNYNNLYDKFYKTRQVTFYLDYSNRIVSDIMNERIKGIERDHSLALLPLPSQSQEGKNYLGGSMLAVSAESKNKEQAWDIIKYLTEDDTVEMNAMLSGDIPALDIPFWKKHGDDPTLQMLYNEMKNSISYPVHPLWRGIEVVLAEGIYRSFLSINQQTESEAYEEINGIISNTLKKIKEILDITWEI